MAVQKAHELGKPPYSKSDLLQKARILRAAGIDAERTRHLMEAGVVGNAEAKARALPLSASASNQLFQPRIAVNQLRNKLASTPGANEAKLYVGNGGEADVYAVIRVKDGKETIVSEKIFEAEDQVQDHIKALKQMSDYSDQGKLGPFSVVKVKEVNGKTLKTEYIEGRSINDIASNPEFRNTDAGKKIIQSYVAGLREAAAQLRNEGYFVQIIKSDPAPYMWVFKERGGGEHIFDQS